MFVSGMILLTFFISSGVAFRWGGFDERFVAAAMTLATIASNLAIKNDFAGTESGVLIVDFLLFAVLMFIALRSDRFWPMWAAAFQLVAMLVHMGSTVQSGNFAWAYYFALVFWSFPAMLALGVGTWLEARKRQFDVLD